MDPSDNVCIEYLRPKTVPEGLIALGSVIQISEIQVKLQITGGIVCLVDRLNISQSYTKLLEHHSKVFQDGSQTPARLPQLFKRGQQYVCKIIEKKPRKGYADAQDIFATLDPSSLQEDNLPKTLLAIPQVPLQCAVQSIEDHGYQMDIGFKGLTGFLTFDEAEAYCEKHNDGNKFFVGQIIRCCLREAISFDGEDLQRVVHLALNKDSMSKSVFSQEKVSENILTENCILPGSRAFGTVMKVQKDGLIVNFLNEFAGFVGTNHLKDTWHSTKENYKISDQFKCTVLYYNNITKNFALSIRDEKRAKKTLRDFIKNYHVGQIINEAKVAYLDGAKSVTFKVNSYKAVANVKDALDEDVATMSKDDIHLALDSAYPDGSQHKCRIKSINLVDLILVLSLRQDFMKLSHVSIEELKPADFIEATVKKLVKEGIVVTFGLNLRGIILNSNLHDFVSIKSHKKYTIGKNIKCRVLKVDHTKQPARVYLTNKEQLMDPEMVVIDSYDRSWKGKSTHATVFKIRPDGLIVELFNNIKGFIPRRFLSTVPLKNVDDLFSVGQVTSCVVYRVNPGRQSLLLGAIPFEKISLMKKEKRQSIQENKQSRKRAKLEIITGQKKEKVEEKSLDKETLDEDMLDKEKSVADNIPLSVIKSRRQRSEEAKLREEKLREAERRMLDPDRPPQTILDFERLVLKTPNSADIWVRYSKFFLDNVETEKARIVCRRALRTISFRLEKEKLKVWLHLVKIEAKYGGTEKLRETIDEAAQTNDKLKVYEGSARVLSNCGELDEAQRLYELMVKMGRESVQIWVNYIQFEMEHRSNFDKARTLFEQARKCVMSTDLVFLKSRFAQFEFKYGDVERGKTMFVTLLSEYPKRKDLAKVYEDMTKKYDSRQKSRL